MTAADFPPSTNMSWINDPHQPSKTPLLDALVQETRNADAASVASSGVVSPLEQWWRDTVARDLAATLPKALEYGSIELIEAGRVLASIIGLEDVTDARAMETQIYQYVLGKMGRWTAAMRRKEQVSDDTIFDIFIYALMVRKIRETGVWP